MTGIAIIRIEPSDKVKDPSKKDIENLAELSNEIFDYRLLIGAEVNNSDIECYTPGKTNYNNILMKVASLIRYQLLIALEIIRKRNELDVVLFHAGGYLLLPILLMSNIIGMETVVAVIGEPSKGYKDSSFWGGSGKIIFKFSIRIERAVYLFSDKITVFSESMTNYDLLDGLNDKIYLLRFNYVNIPKEVRGINKRDNTIVYFGRICSLKGADKLADTIEILSAENSSLVEKVIFVGDGDLKKQIKKDIEQINGIKVEFTGWLERQKALQKVENSQLFVLPSRSEGLPKALQEAMARGTIPLVTPVGDMPNFIKDFENGALISREPRNIKEKIIEIKKRDMDRMSSESYLTAKEEFSYQRSLSQFVNIFKEYDS